MWWDTTVRRVSVRVPTMMGVWGPGQGRPLRSAPRQCGSDRMARCWMSAQAICSALAAGGQASSNRGFGAPRTGHRPLQRPHPAHRPADHRRPAVDAQPVGQRRLGRHLVPLREKREATPQRLPSARREEGPVLPWQPPSTFGATTNQRSVSTACQGPIRPSHQPRIGGADVGQQRGQIVLEWCDGTSGSRRTRGSAVGSGNPAGALFPRRTPAPRMRRGARPPRPAHGAAENAAMCAPRGACRPGC